MKKTKFVIFTAFCACAALSAFDWPEENQVNSDSFYSYFGQLRGNIISSSLIFQEPSSVLAAEDGKISMTIVDYHDDSDFFPSALGNAVAVSHKDSLETVYGNLDNDALSKAMEKNDDVKVHELLGESGNSGWQQGRSALEFQVIDTKNRIAINPRILMPRIGNELELSTHSVVLIGKNGKRYDLTSTRSIPSGTYKIYQKRLPVAVPNKTQVLINGTLVDSISLETLSESGTSVCFKGKKDYNMNEIYPDENLMLTGSGTFTQGQNLLQITLKDINEKKEYSTNYILSVY